MLLLTFTAIWGLPGYTFKGIYKEIQKHLGSSVQNYIVAARTAQGYDEWHKSSHEERLDVVRRWHALQVELAEEKQQARHGSFHGPQNCKITHHLNHKERQRIAEEKKLPKMSRKSSRQSKSSAAKPTVARTATPENGDFEEAIQASIAATSKGNPDEDRMIEQAIRASVLELQTASKDGDDADALQRAIQASVAEAARARKHKDDANQVSQPDDITDHDRELAEALHRSLTQEERHPLAGADFDDSGVDTDDDENMKAAIQQSRASIEDNASDKGLQQAMKTSQEVHKHHTVKLNKTKTEEEIVLDYVKRQSLLEAQFQKDAAKP